MRTRVVSKTWDHNGGFDLVIEADQPTGERNRALDARVRRAARAADPMGLILHTHIRNVVPYSVSGPMTTHLYTVHASRLTTENGG